MSEVQEGFFITDKHGETWLVNEDEVKELVGTVEFPSELN